MKIPKRIPIAGHWYDIVYAEHLRRDEGLIGAITYNKFLIELDPDVDSRGIGETFIHETCHMVNKHFCNNRMAEDDINGFSEGLHQVLNYLGIVFTRG